MKVITAKSGKILRDYVHVSFKDNTNKRVAIFPESGLDANEQAAFLLENGHKYDIVITLSAFIISDAKNLIVLGEIENKPKFGESVNRINMNLWRRETIGDLGKKKIEELNEMPYSDELVEQTHKEVGDSVERVLFLNRVFNKMDEMATSSPKKNSL